MFAQQPLAFVNHVATNVSPKTMRWIRLQLRHVTVQLAPFSPMPARGVTSWVRLLCRAATENSNISQLQLLPRYTSRAQPPANVIDDLEYLVATMEALLGPLPACWWHQALRQHPERYLSWLHLVLTELQAAQSNPTRPSCPACSLKTGHHNSFIKISTTSLCSEVKLMYT